MLAAVEPCPREFDRPLPKLRFERVVLGDEDCQLGLEHRQNGGSQRVVLGQAVDHLRSRRHAAIEPARFGARVLYQLFSPRAVAGPIANEVALEPRDFSGTPVQLTQRC